MPCVPVHAQLTSSRSVAVLPLVAASPDSALAADLDLRLIEAIRPPILRRGLLLELVGRDLQPRQIARMMSRTMQMADYARDVGAAFLLGGSVYRTTDGDLLLTLSLYGADDRKYIASDWRAIADDDSAAIILTDMAGRICRPRVLTPADTPIFYSIFLPGSGQIMMGQPIHGVFCAGLFVSAFFSHRDRDPPIRQALLPRYREEQKRKRLNQIVKAWLINVADTVVICQWRSRNVDTSVFISVMESQQWMEPGTLPSTCTPGLGMRIVFR